MLGVRGMLFGFVGAVLMVAIAACGPVPSNSARANSSNLALAATPGTPTASQTGAVVWGKVPYCNCLATSATANVANALKQANLTVHLKELSPHDGWLYFTVTFDPHTATTDQVGSALIAGGGQVLQGPP